MNIDEILRQIDALLNHQRYCRFGTREWETDAELLGILFKELRKAAEVPS